MDSLNAKPTQLQFGAISYGMDYLDSTNMLGIWLFGAAILGRMMNLMPW